MKKLSQAKLLVLVALTVLCGAASSFGGVTYQQTSATGLFYDNTVPPTALDDINLAAGSTTIRQILTNLTFGVVVLPGTTAQTAVVFIDFYDTVNMASTGVVESNYIGGFGGTLNITANTGTSAAARTFSFSGLSALSTPIYFNDPNIGIVITLANAAGTAYSTVLAPLSSVPGVPTIGSSVTGLYRDAGNDDFQATDFSASSGNLYLSLTTANAPIPEPTSLALLGFGGLAGLVAYQRRKK